MPHPYQSFQRARPKIITTIPCFNTESSIGDVVSRTTKYVDQVIVIDDGSSDDTVEAARVAGALAISHGVNRGYGEAIKSCFEAGRAGDADILVTLDGDGQHNPDEIQRVVAPILSGEADIVVGSRFLGSQGNMPRYRRFGIRVITFLFNFGSKAKVSDAQSGFRAYSKKVLTTISITEARMSISIETLVKARRNGFVIKEVPVSCYYIPSRLNINAIKHGLSVAFAVIKIRFKSLFRASFGGKEGRAILNLHNLKQKVACLALDVEQDYGDLLDEPSYEGLEHIPGLIKFLKGKDIPLTCFVQGSLLETHPTNIKELSALDVEFELHSYSHPGPREINAEIEINKGKQAYRRFFGKDPMGYRAPLGFINDKHLETLASYGFKFDSSIFPTLRPGVFNNLRKATTPYSIENPKIVEFPFTVFSNFMRVPIALSYVRLFGKPYLYLLKTCPLPKLIVFYFHLYDLFNLNSSTKIPLEKFPFIYRRIFKRIYQSRQDGLSLFDELIGIFQKRGYTFLKLEDIYEATCK